MRLKHNKKIMLIDFGAVKEISTLNNNTSATIIGTDGYRPREQEIGKPEFCSDIYALGMVAIYASIPFFERFKNFILSPIGLSSSGIILIF